jgi:hypothetical protein
MKCRVKRHTVVQPLDQSYRLIPLTQGQNAIVDAEDFEWLSQWNWHAQWDSSRKTFIAFKSDGPKTRIAMSNTILHCDRTRQVDHQNFYTLDNRKENLRKCTPAENSRHRRKRSDNTSGFKGVHWDKRKKRWRATIITPEGIRKSLGRYKSVVQAAHAYDEGAKKYHGEFAHLNFA